ncbi:MAG: hypothetical protein KJZ56_11320 [Flavobacteriales bacterium]|jgi:hypothetical protein|nr:hypothetical protein [Flavobacteriales bacterium]
MKSLNYIIAFAFVSICYSQSNAQNPYDAIGKKTTMLTLTKGKYPEYIPYDSIQRIGSVVINVKQMTVLSFLDRDSINMSPEISSRWWAPDPLAHRYVPISPYAFSLNNPIYFVDGDGRVVLGTDGKPVTIDKDTKGNYVISGKPDKATSQIFTAMIKTQTGADAAIHMTTIPTKVKLVLTEKAIFNEEGQQIHGDTKGKGEIKDEAGNAYYKSAVVTVSTAEIEENPNDRLNKFSDEEKINAIGTHEDVHLKPEQIISDKKYKAGEIGLKQNEQAPVKQEYESRKEYRKQYGKEGDRDITPNYEKFLKDE